MHPGGLVLHRLKCRQCSALWWPTLPFMVGTHRFVRSFALTVLDMLRFSTIRSVAEYLGVGWDLVKNIHKERLQFLYRKIPEQFLAVWCRDAMNSGIRALKRVGKTLGAYRTCLLNYFKHRITSGAVEGLINKIKTLKRQAYGFRDPEYFKLRLYHLNTQRYSLAG